jgi:hypothetical protein
MSNRVNDTIIAARVPVSLRDQLFALPESHDRSVSYEIRKILNQYVGGAPPPRPHATENGRPEEDSD